jgi:hypothetical protein
MSFWKLNRINTMVPENTFETMTARRITHSASTKLKSSKASVNFFESTRSCNRKDARSQSDCHSWCAQQCELASSQNHHFLTRIHAGNLFWLTMYRCCVRASHLSGAKESRTSSVLEPNLQDLVVQLHQHNHLFNRVQNLSNSCNTRVYKMEGKEKPRA